VLVLVTNVPPSVRINTDTLARGAPLAASVTVPVIEPVWAAASTPHATTRPIRTAHLAHAPTTAGLNMAHLKLDQGTVAQATPPANPTSITSVSESCEEVAEPP
jgi:hypothetical protein